MDRPFGMAPEAFHAYILACFKAGINPQTTSQDSKRVLQTIGNAPASMGFHSEDDPQDSSGIGVPYCAALDLSVRGLDEEQIHRWLEEMSRVGFAGWYRFKGGFSNNEHIHAIYAGLKMKPQLQAQIADFLENRTGLSGHEEETFFTAPPEIDAEIERMFARANADLRLQDPHRRGKDVRALQAALKQAGIAVAVDGDFGPQTAAAVKAFQRQRGVLADGFVGPKTRAALNL